MVFLSNYLVFKIVLAALGRVDYPVAGDLELKYDTANKIYLSGGSSKYIDSATLWSTIGEETTQYDIDNSLNLDASNEQILYADDAEGGDEFGNSCDVHGEYAVVGASKEHANGVSDAGSVYVYHRSGNTWTQQAKLTASDGEASDYLGGQKGNLAIYGDTVVVGARDEDTGGSAAGSAYVFVRSGTTWSQQAILRASNAGASDQFATGVAIYKDTIVIGAPTEDTTASDAGSIYVFTRSGTTWTQRAQLQASNAGANDRLGDSVSIDGDTIIAGAYQEDTTASDAGSAYIFTGSGATWTQQAQIQASDAAANDKFGDSVSISGNTVVVSSRKIGSGSTAGSVYVFVRSGTTWTQQAQLTASDAAANDDFGWGLDIDKDHIVVSAYGEDTGGSEAGAIYVFSRSGSTWTEIKKIQASNPSASDYLGYGGVGIHDGTIITSAPNEDTEASDAGAAYIYPSQVTKNYYITEAGKYSVDATIAGLKYKTNEVEVTSLNPGNAVYTNDLRETSEIDHGTSASTLKACSVSLDGTRVALGATDGRVKVYHLETGVWTLKKEYTKTNNFGAQVCLNDVGTRLFVSDPTDNSGTGKVYVYDYSGSVWGSSETHSWVSPNGSTSDNFGGIAGKGISCNSAGTRLLVVNGYTGSKKGYIFDHNGTNWNTAPTKSWSSGKSWWGTTCSLNDAGDRAFIGYENGVDIFHYDGSNWPTSETKNYTGSNRFGGSLTINGAGTRLLVGSYEYSSSGGKTDLYDYVGSSWNTSATQTINAPYGSSSLYGHGVNMSRDGKRYLVAAHNSSTYFSSGGHVDMMEDTTGSGSFTLKQIFKPDQASENMGSYQFHEGICLDQKGYTAVILSTGTDVSRIYSSNPIPILNFDGYNKLSIGNAPTSTSSKLFLGSDVYDIGTHTSGITIETPGVYKSITYDTSSNVAYFNKVTVGAIGSTMSGFELANTLYGTVQSGHTHGSSQGGFGNNTILNADGTRLLVTDPLNYPSGRGRAHIYHLESGSWVLKQTWDNPDGNSQRFTDGACMNEDGTRLFLQHPSSNAVYTYEYASGAWPTANSGTHVFYPGSTMSHESSTVACNKAGDVIVIGYGNANKVKIYRRTSATSWSIDSGGDLTYNRSVAMSGDGTRAFMGHSDGKIYMVEWNGSTWSSATAIITTSGYQSHWAASMMSDSAGETLVIRAEGTATDAGIYERASNGTWSRAQGVEGRTQIYGTAYPSISYDGTMVLIADYHYDSNKGRAYLWQKSGGSWSRTKTYDNPHSSPASNDYWGAGCGIARTTKDKFVIGFQGDSTAGTDYGSVWTYTNAIPDFISFDTYNKLSLSGITNPTSKIHALPTGAESTTTYDIGTASNMYIEDAGTYTAEMKGSDGFALDSNVVGTVNALEELTPLISWTNLGTTLASDNGGAYTFTASGSNYSQVSGSGNNYITNTGNEYLYVDFSALRSSDKPFRVDWEVYGSSWQFSLNFGQLIGTSGTSNWDTQNNSVGLMGDLSLHIPNGGVVGTGTTISTYGTTTWVKVSFRREANGNTVKFYINDTYISEITPTPSTHPLGFEDPVSQISLFKHEWMSTPTQYTSSGTRVRNIKVWDVTTVSVPKLTFDGFNKYTFIGADTGSTYKLKYFSNTYDLGTTSTVYIKDPGTYSAEIKGATNFALSSNVTGNLGTYLTLHDNVAISHTTGGGDTTVTVNNIKGNMTYKIFFNNQWTDSNGAYSTRFGMKIKDSNDDSIRDINSFSEYSGNSLMLYDGGGSFDNTVLTASSQFTVSGDRVFLNGATPFTLADSFYILLTMSTSDVITGKFFIGDTEVVTYFETTAGRSSDTGTIGETGNKFDFIFPSTATISGVNMTVEEYNPAPELDFDGYNKLTFSGLESGSTSTSLRLGSNTYDIGTASNVYISEQGTYEAESKGTTTFALVKKQVTGTIGPNTTPVFTPVQLDADPVTDPQPSGNRSFRWQSTTGTKHYYRGYNGNTIDAGPMLIYYDTSDKKWYDGDTADHPNSFVVTTTQAVPSLSGATDPSSATGTSNAEYIHCCRINGTHLFSFKMAGWVTPTNPSLTFDGYKLVVSGITPTSTTLKYGSNTYEIGSATNIYVKDTGAYTAEIGGAADFALTSNTVSGTLKTIEPGFASRYQGSMALTYDGKLYGWGMNNEGEAGVGTSSDITVPTLCTGITQGTVAKLLSSSDLTDNSRGEVSYVKTIDGKIYATGKGTNFVIPGTTSDLTSFTDVTSYFGDQSLTANTVTMMSFTDRSGAALTETGNVWTWGTHDSTYKALGQASASSSSTPKQINFSSATGNITKITSGHRHSLALDSSGDVWFWGKNNINSDSWPSSITDEPQKVVDGKNIIGLASSYGTMYAWDATGKMWNAGNNWEGQIGDGTTTASSTGKTLTEVTYFSSKGITINKVYGGGYFTFANTSDGYYCWGNGGHGVFGNGGTGSLTSGPVKWTHVSNIKKFMASTQHTTAITEDGKYYAWGRDYHGGRGDSDSSSDISYPKYIDGLPNILAPSFEFDGYDKVFMGGTFVYEFYVSVKAVGSSGLHYVNINQLSSSTMTLKSNMVTVHVPIYSGSAASMFDGSNSTYISINDPNHEVDTKLWTLVTDKELADLTFVADRPVYMPGWRITCNGKIVLNDTTSSASTTPSPATFTKLLSPSGSTKFTKGTTTYDVGKASIVTVSDPGTYDAQLNKSGVFSIESATVPATKTTGLYTWAFHHGNFDNAYGDGDILTARENGRFYADTPAYTGDIGTISTELVVSSTQNFASTISPTGTGDWVGSYYWNLDNSQTTTTAVFYELNPGSGVNGFELRAVGLTTELHCNTGNNSTGDPGWFHSNTNTTARRNGVIALGETITLYRNYDPPSAYVGSFTVTSGHLFSFATSNKLHTKYTFAPPSGGLTANVMMVAGGGGGGGRYHAGGGGAGGLVYTAGTSLANGATKTIVVGNGDSGGNADGSNATNGFNGKNTTFTGLDNAVGGGGGGKNYTAANSGGSGGGGGASQVSGTPSAGGSGTANQGNDGGVGITAASGQPGTNRSGGGGGGAGGVGIPGVSSSVSGEGGIGKFFGTGSSFTNFGDEYGEGGYFAGGGGGGVYHSGIPQGIPGRGGGGYGADEYGYMGIGGSQHALPHTGGGGGGSGMGETTDQHRDFNSAGDGGVLGHGGRGGSGIVLIQTNVAPPNGANTAVVQVGNPRRRSLPPAVDLMGSEVNRAIIIHGDSTPTYKLPTHWYWDPVGSNSNDTLNSGGGDKFFLVKRPDGITSNVFYIGQATSGELIEYGTKMAQTADAVFMPIESQNYDTFLCLGSNGANDIHLGMNSNGVAVLRRNNAATDITVGTIKCFTVGKWHHVALTVDSGGNAVGYVNGYPVVTGTYASMPDVGSRSGHSLMRVNLGGGGFRKSLTYECSTYNFHMSPKQVLQRAAEVGCGPKLEYDGLNTIKILNTEPGSSVKLFTSNVADTSNVFIVADPAAGEYTVPESGKYYAEIKGTDTFTITKTLDVSGTFPLYAYPPRDGTHSSITTTQTVNQWSTWTISGAANGNGQYQARSNHTCPSSTRTSYSAFKNDITPGAGEHNMGAQSGTRHLDLQLPSAKTIRKYIVWLTDSAFYTGNATTTYTQYDPVGTMAYNGNERGTRRIKSWTIQGSNNDSDWTTIHTVTNKPPSNFGDIHTISSPGSYQYYRIAVTEHMGSSQVTMIGELVYYGD